MWVFLHHLLQTEHVQAGDVENVFGLIVSLCARGWDKASDCVAPRLGQGCRATPLNGNLLLPESWKWEAEDNRIPAAVFYLLHRPNALRVLNTP